MKNIIDILSLSFKTLLPALFIGVVIISYLIFYLYKKSKQTQFKLDDYRHDLELKINELNQNLTFSKERFESINHLLLESQNKFNYFKNNNNNISINDFLNKMNIDPNIKIKNDLVFVLTPFNIEFESIYNRIKKIIEDIGFQCLRGNEKKISGPILQHILGQIVQARLIIANITGRNPNVFYELGIAHALNKPTLLISETIDKIPFDISNTRVLTYTNSFQLENELKTWIVQTFAEIK